MNTKFLNVHIMLTGKFGSTELEGVVITINTVCDTMGSSNHTSCNFTLKNKICRPSISVN